jgi:hypothetical protein
MALDEPNERALLVEEAIARAGGRFHRGMVAERELGGDVDIRVSMRSAQYLGSVELFTLRKLEPGDYHLYLVAIPRGKNGNSAAPQSSP